MTSYLKKYAEKNNIKFFYISFTDMMGVMRSKMIPASAIENAEKDGAGFAGFAAYLNLAPSDADVFGKPDVETVITLPWQKDVAWVAADLYMNGKEIAHAPRNVLRNIRDKAAQENLQLKTGVECEFFLLDKEKFDIADSQDTKDKPCYDQLAISRNFNIISRISEALEELGWGVYQADHEDSNGQFEINWGYADCLVTADRHAFFKFMVQSLAEEEGLRASFMPKPLSNRTGNGCHIHLSLWNDDDNIFDDSKGELGLSEKAYHFLGGMLNSASAMTAITNPTVNSYKRINAASTNSGSSWAPNMISYSGNNRTHMVRIPDNGRFELRLPDGAANPYLLPAIVLALGLNGIDEQTSPGKRIDSNMYINPPKNVKYLPKTLIEALEHLNKSKVIRKYLGNEFVDSYILLKKNEWNLYNAHVSRWEQDHYLDI